MPKSKCNVSEKSTLHKVTKKEITATVKQKSKTKPIAAPVSKVQIDNTKKPGVIQPSRLEDKSKSTNNQTSLPDLIVSGSSKQNKKMGSDRTIQQIIPTESNQLNKSSSKQSKSNAESSNIVDKKKQGKSESSANNKPDSVNASDKESKESGSSDCDKTNTPIVKPKQNVTSEIAVYNEQMKIRKLSEQNYKNSSSRSKTPDKQNNESKSCGLDKPNNVFEHGFKNKQNNESNSDISNKSDDKDGQSKVSLTNRSKNPPEGYPIGLMNTELTGYMNSVSQALASSTILIKQLCELNKSVTSNNLDIFLQILQDINQTSDPKRSIDDVTNKLQLLITTVKWNRSSQQDAFQVLSFIINAIQKEMIPKQMLPPKFRILHTFSEDAKYNKIQDHLALALPLCGKFIKRPGEKLEKLLDAFFEQSIIDDGPNTTTMYLFEEAPSVIIIHIQANQWDPDLAKYIKPIYYIDYKERFEYTFIIQMSKDGSKSEPMIIEYQLMAVVQHFGNVSDGHYIAYRKHNQQWYLTNDEQVEQTSFNCDIIPYIMVYEKIKKNEF